MKIFAKEKEIIGKHVPQIMKNAASNQLHTVYTQGMSDVQYLISAFTKADHTPTIREMIDVYNGWLTRIVNLTNEFLAQSKLGAINVNDILIAQPKSGISAIDLSDAIGTQPVTDANIVSEAENALLFFNRYAVDNEVTTGDIFISALNGLYNREKKYQLFMARFGYGNITIAANVAGKGTRFLRKVNCPAEVDDFYKRAISHSYEAVTQKNPNFEGRAKAYSWLGKEIAAGFDYEQLTPEVEILEKDNLRFISMGSAGDVDLGILKKQAIPVTNEMISSSIVVQIINWLAGQCDASYSNVMLTQKTGLIKAIDPGLTFPPWEFGENATEGNMNLGHRLTVDYLLSNGKSLGDPDYVPAFYRFSSDCDRTGKRIIYDLPPLPEEGAKFLLEFTNPEGGKMKEFIKFLQGNGFTELEIKSFENRAATLHDALGNVQPIDSKEKYLDLWKQENSPLTVKNCYLRRLPD
jgi:hypothetical protein